MPVKKTYAASSDELEKKLARVMKRLGVPEGKYQYDWTQNRDRASCYVQMVYHGSAYRFENDTDKSAESGRNLRYTSDLFAEIVYSLEGLARAVERGIFTLDMLLAGVPALPAAEPLEPCFAALGFTRRPERAEEVTSAYHRLAPEAHPDTGGSAEKFRELRENYRKAMEIMGGNDNAAKE